MLNACVEDKIQKPFKSRTGGNLLFRCQLSQISFEFYYLFLVPFEVWEENKTNVWVWVFVDDPLCLGLLLQDVVYPLFGAERDA